MARVKWRIVHRSGGLTRPNLWKKMRGLMTAFGACSVLNQDLRLSGDFG